MIILVLNCGSSSIKFQLLNMADKKLLAKGLVERIGIKDSVITQKTHNDKEYREVTDIPNHTIGIDLILKALTSPNHGVIKSVNEINAVGHRVAHGGENFTQSALITKKVKEDIEKCIELAPLHNPANLMGINSMESLLPNVKQVAVFDTSFHQTMPDKAYLFAVPYEYYDKYKIRRYGFHGTSHKFVAEKCCKMKGVDFEKVNIITCHLGNGASIAAIKKGKSFDTSMGFTPVDGLMMGTRSGSVDPGALLFLAEKEGLNVKQLNDLINKKSGLLGISGLSSDMRDLENAANSGNKRAALAIQMFAYRVKKFIGGYAAAMGGVDCIIFTGGIGENACDFRRMCCEGLEFLGVDFDVEKNKNLRGVDEEISKPNSKVKVFTITTNEELVIATDTVRIVSELK
ncbi:MAG: acetate/propionate family kinase [Salinivirgaceae bacterium]|jgi:acetate kinase|nr:acetate kinase [Bacteroidales bacterium]